MGSALVQSHEKTVILGKSIVLQRTVIECVSASGWIAVAPPAHAFAKMSIAVDLLDCILPCSTCNRLYNSLPHTPEIHHRIIESSVHVMPGQVHV